MTRPKQIIINDNAVIKNLFVQFNLQKNSVSVLSNFSAWENLALIIEALAVTAEQCVKEGIERKQVNEEIRNYLKKTLDTGKILTD